MKVNESVLRNNDGSWKKVFVKINNVEQLKEYNKLMNELGEIFIDDEEYTEEIAVECWQAMVNSPHEDTNLSESFVASPYYRCYHSSLVDFIKNNLEVVEFNEAFITWSNDNYMDFFKVVMLNAKKRGMDREYIDKVKVLITEMKEGAEFEVMFETNKELLEQCL